MDRLGERLRGEEARASVRAWLERLRIPLEVIEAPRAPTAPIEVRERLSGKSFRFALGTVTEAEEARNPENGSRYLRVLLEDGRTFALSPLGVVFAPSFLSTGPVPDCPATACFLDFDKLLRHLTHLVSEARDEHHREALQVLMVLLAFLEGARRVGFDVGEEERELDALLAKLEA